MIDGTTIKAANERAIAGWNGLDLKSGRPLNPSDRQLLSQYCQKVINAKRNKAAVTIGEIEIRDLMRVARLGPLFLNNAIDYKGLAEWLSIEGTHKRIDNAGSLPLQERCDETLAMLKEVAGAMHKEDDGQQIALASRILFFALPELPFFNVSSGVASELGIRQHTTNLKAYWDALTALLVKHHAELSQCNRPAEFEKQENPVIKAAMKGDWWQRRVLDYALLTD
jgi:hypothetical protein